MRALRTILALDAHRRGDQFLIGVDLPGIATEDVDVTVESNVVNIRARRVGDHDEDEEILANERPEGEFVRQLFLGDNLDASQLSPRWRTAFCVSSCQSRRRASRDEWRSPAGSIVG